MDDIDRAIAANHRKTRILRGVGGALLILVCGSVLALFATTGGPGNSRDVRFLGAMAIGVVAGIALLASALFAKPNAQGDLG